VTKSSFRYNEAKYKIKSKKIPLREIENSEIKGGIK